MDGDDIIESRVKPVLKSKISEITTNYSMMDIYSGNRSKLNSELTDYLNSEFSDKYGIEVLDASIIDVHPDKKLILSGRSDSAGEGGNHQQRHVVYHHREIKCRILVVSVE